MNMKEIINIEIEYYLVRIMQYIRANNNEEALKEKMRQELYKNMSTVYTKGFEDAKKIYGK